MIINVCDKTPDPSLCQTCLNSDPKSKTADVRNDTALHNLLDNCWTRFIGARDGIDGAGRKNPEVAVPKYIIDETNVVSTDCQIILGILNNF
ncbi:hypothetical protein Golax_022477 [Gossypium laxum]|uniref:Pectinesterase inhibitor domain-containing protein n=1 Tax=Gossypium laxum TaxID=34288 RepID=A0A7J9B0Q6_9ROSI|nr:hypothetical protein [Gossypium laxum]